jgi:hypothetical protein
MFRRWAAEQLHPYIDHMRHIADHAGHNVLHVHYASLAINFAAETRRIAGHLGGVHIAHQAPVAKIGQWDIRSRVKNWGDISTWFPWNATYATDVPLV